MRVYDIVASMNDASQKTVPLIERDGTKVKKFAFPKSMMPTNAVYVADDKYEINCIPTREIIDKQEYDKYQTNKLLDNMKDDLITQVYDRIKLEEKYTKAPIGLDTGLSLQIIKEI